MFLLFFVDKKQFNIPFEQGEIFHNHCGKYGRMQLFYIANVFRLFFIPLFKYHKRYFVRMSCCGEVYEVEAKLAKKVKRRKKLSLALDELIDLNDYRQLGQKVCSSCGYIIKEKDKFCSQCGSQV